MGTAFLTQAPTALDRARPQDRGDADSEKLVATADVFVENYRPGALRRSGWAMRRYRRSIRG
jgi:crotonobetainyl-CoA:carnitine CoA-transferase CaiB-like acyl-CoA transferase